MSSSASIHTSANLQAQAKMAEPSALVIISGRGSNLNSILQAEAGGALGGTVAAVLSNRPEAAGLEVATRFQKTAQTLDHTGFDSREAFDQALAESIDAINPDLIVLAGFMRILTESFVVKYAGRMINIHPSLLPMHPGLRPHRKALQAGDREHGASVHFVTPAVDGGPVIAQGKLRIRPEDTEQSLADRVLEIEHQIYPQVIHWFFQGRLKLRENKALLDGKVLPDIGIDLTQPE